MLLYTIQKSTQKKETNSKMLTATLTNTTDELDTVTVYADNVAVDRVKVVPTGKAADYEKALTVAGYVPTAFDGTQWTVEKF